MAKFAPFECLCRGSIAKMLWIRTPVLFAQWHFLWLMNKDLGTLVFVRFNESIPRFFTKGNGNRIYFPIVRWNPNGYIIVESLPFTHY